MQRVYFDSHVYDALIEPGNKSIRDQLLLSIRTRRCEVYGSLTTIEELGGVAAKDTSRYRSLIDCFWDCVRTDVLLDRALLLQAEWRKTERPGMQEACFRKSLIDGEIRRASYENQRMTSIAEEVLGEKRDEAAAMNKLFEEVECEVAEAMNKRFEENECDVTEAAEEEQHRHEPKTDPAYRQWLNGVSEGEVQEWLDTHRTRDGASCISWRRAPCASALIGWMIARAKMNLMDAKQYERSASHDRDHFIFGTQTGTLVTNDQGLARTVRFIHLPLATVQTPDQFFESVLSVDKDD